MRLTLRGRRVRAAGLLTAAGIIAVVLLGQGDGDAARSRDAQPAVERPRPTVAPTTVASPSPATTVRQKQHVRRDHPTGVLHVMPHHGPVVGHGPLLRYRVAVEGGLRIDRQAFVHVVRDTLGDRRGWGRDMSFERVASGTVAFTIVLASPAMTDRLCAPMQTRRIYSCFNDGRSVVNIYRWRNGAAAYGWTRHLTSYRHYVVLHEVGHALGHGHVYACRADGAAPTMMQQTKSLNGCRRNAWPYR